MADEVEEQVEESLNMVAITKEQSSNMRKALKLKIFETLSTLRTLFAKLKDKEIRKTQEINNLKKQVGEMGTELKQCRERLMEEYRATSMDRTTELELEPSMDGTKEREEGRIECPSATFIDQATEPTGNLKRHVALPINNSRRNYAEIVQSPKVKSFKMTIKSRDTHPPENLNKF